MANFANKSKKLDFGVIPRKKGGKKDFDPADEDAALLAAIEDIKREMVINQEHFDAATDETLIDSYIYAIMSAQMKYQYFLKICKEKNLAVGTI